MQKIQEKKPSTPRKVSNPKEKEKEKEPLSEKYISKKCKDIYDLIWDADKNVRVYERCDKVRDVFNKHVRVDERLEILIALARYSNVVFEDKVDETNLVESLACYSRAMIKEYR